MAKPFSLYVSGYVYQNFKYKSHNYLSTIDETATVLKNLFTIKLWSNGWIRTYIEQHSHAKPLFSSFSVGLLG